MATVTAPDPSGFGLRLLAFGIDLAVLTAAGAVIFSLPGLKPVWIPGLVVPRFDTYSDIIGVGILWTYNVIMVKRYRATLGKMVFGLSVVDIDGQPLDWLTVINREVVGKLISTLTLGLGFFWIAWDAQKQGFHDKIAGTLVIKE